MTTQHFNSPNVTIETANGINFYSQARHQQMRYLYPDCGHHWAGWILYKHPDGQWVSLRKATDADIAELSAAVSKAHHEGPPEEDQKPGPEEEKRP
jgi:hypothetical protein